MADSPQDTPRHAGRMVRRVLLRRNIAVDAETAQLVADAVQAALRAGPPGALAPQRRVLIHYRHQGRMYRTSTLEAAGCYAR